MLEPTSRGYQLRVQTRKGDARMVIGFVTSMLLAAHFVFIPFALSSHVPTAGGWLWDQR